MSECILRTSGLCKNFGGVVAVKDFDFEVSCGEVVQG